MQLIPSESIARDKSAATVAFNRRAYSRAHSKPRPGEGVPLGTCPRCGLRGPHRGKNGDSCIAALRDRLADLE